MKKALALLLSLLISAVSFAQQINSAKLDSLFNNLDKHNLGMVGIAIKKDGKIVYQRSTGYAIMDSVKMIKADANTAYRLGSITKMFTAVMAFQLIDEKKLSLNDTLSKFFPDLPNAKRITIRELMYHRSGLANFTSNGSFDDWKDKPHTHEQLLNFIKQQKTDFEPNAKADYNNSNYLLLGYIIEKITNKPYKELVNKRIISKIGLTQTYYAGTEGKLTEAASYKYFNGKWKADKVVDLNNFSGAGAIISTTSDMLKFINALFDGKLVSKASFTQMTTMVDGYGMGIFPYEEGEHHGFGHNGKTEGFASSLQIYPKDKLSLAFCTNAEAYPKAEILDDVLKICFDMPCEIPTFQPVILSDSLLNKYPGTYKGASNGITVACSRDNGNLIFETHGQKMVLDALANDKFYNKPYGFFFEFDDNGKTLYIYDVDDVYKLVKQ
ncbi:MAG: serine hydrolase domain-containing protein [Mucilaginibacter sp.]